MPDGCWGHRQPLPSSSQRPRNLRKRAKGENTIRVRKPCAQRKFESSLGWGEVAPKSFLIPLRPGWVPSSLFPRVPVVHHIMGHGKHSTVPELGQVPKLRTKGARNLVPPHPEGEAGLARASYNTSPQRAQEAMESTQKSQGTGKGGFT